MLWALTLAFAYHKLIPTCSKADPIQMGGVQKPKPNWRCTEAEMDQYSINAGMDHDGLIAYDILPVDARIGYCSGALCRRATEAVDGYRNLLHLVTPTRTALLGALVQRKCPYDDGGEFLRRVERIQRELPGVIDGLRAAKDGLVAKCVVPSRRIDPKEMVPAGN